MSYSVSKNDTIILESYQRDAFIFNLLQKNEAITHLQLTSLNNVLQFDDTTDFDLFVRCYQALQQAPLTMLQQYRESIDLIHELVHLYKIMVVFNIQLEQLPHQTPKQQNLKTLMSLLFQQPTHYQQQVSKLTPKKEYFQLEAFISDPLQYELNLRLQAQKITLPIHNHSKVTAFKTTTTKNEVEAVAQMIINDNLDINQTLIVALNPLYLPIIKSVFARYQIPVSIINDTNPYLFIQQFSLLFRFWQQPTHDNLMACVKANCWQFKHPFKLYQLLSYLQLDVLNHQPLPTLPLNIALLDSQSVAKITNLITLVADDYQHLQQDLTQLLAISDFDTGIEYIYELIRSSIDSESLAGFNRLRQTLRKVVPFVKTTTDKATFLDYFIHSISQQSTTLKHSVLVGDLQHFYIPNRNTCFIIGGSSDNFPNIKKYNGIVDEKYLAAIPYLSQQERFKRHMDQVNRLFSLFENLYISYPYSTFDGKSKDVAFELEAWVKQANTHFKNLNIIENDINITNDYTINPQLYQQLMFPQQQIHGSVSSLELYMSSPYHHFLRYGLKLFPNDLPQLDLALMGTLLHDCLQALVHNHQKNYVNATADDIYQYFQTKIKPLSILIPTKAGLYDFYLQRLTKQLMVTLEFMKDMEQHTDFIPTALEQAFTYPLTIGDTTLILKGFIDRLDTTATYFRIIDYKSSPKTLQLSQIIRGQQLQLLTYLWVQSQQTALKPMGAYYLSLYNSALPIGAFDINYRNHQYTELDENHWKTQYFNKRQLTGMTFGEAVIADDTGTHISDIKAYKSGAIKTSKDLDIMKLQQFVDDVYGYIVEQMKHANISCQPDATNPVHHYYRSICQYKGRVEDKPQITSFDNFEKES